MVTIEKEKQLFRAFEKARESDTDIQGGTHHIDVPFSLPRTKELLLGAGFARVDVLWHKAQAAVCIARP